VCSSGLQTRRRNTRLPRYCTSVRSKYRLAANCPYFISGGGGAILFVVVLGATWPMTMNMRMGMKNVQPILMRAAKTMGYSGSELVWRVMIPAAIPNVLTGARLAWAFGWRALMAAELIGRGGLGRTLMDARDFYNMDLVVSIMIIIAVIGLLVEYFIFSKIERRVLSRWGLSTAS
jgi:NitT/TauT family transport system permease protein